MSDQKTGSELKPIKIWSRDDCSRIPQWVYTDAENYSQELERIFYGPHWHLIGLARLLELKT